MTQLKRCPWCLNTTLEMNYHDTAWGVPLYDDNQLFEFLCLESAQAGLSWLTILRRHEHYRKAFDNFDAQKIANYNASKIEELMQNEGIIRNRLKIKAFITNAQAFLKIQAEIGSFSQYIWSFVKDAKPIDHAYASMDEIPSETSLSQTISKDLKKRGFRFVGPVICYAYMQAIGMVNDHTTDCYRYSEIKKCNKC